MSPPVTPGDEHEDARLERARLEQARLDRASLEHQRIDELLAGYVLRGLSDEDSVEVDRLLSDHVPGCPTCRHTLGDYRSVAADLALDATPVMPPQTLLPRLRRELKPRRRRPAQVFAVAAGVVAVVGLAGLTVTQDLRATRSRSRAADISAALYTASRPGAHMVPVGPATEISAPGSADVYLYGVGVPPAPAGHVYRVWLEAADGRVGYLGELRVEDGVAFAHLPPEGIGDPSLIAALIITVEPRDSAPGQPGRVAWRSAA